MDDLDEVIYIERETIDIIIINTKNSVQVTLNSEVDKAEVVL